MTTETVMAGSTGDGKDYKTLWGHPIGLYVCFATELWERFSFYGMKYLLLLYLTKYHLFTDENGLGIVGAYAGLVYALPLVGGLLADRYLGMRKAVIFGGILLVMGHLLMAVEGTKASMVAGEVIRDGFAINVFYFALALIVLGVGFLKPNISTIVGKLYHEDDPRRDSGFTIFYQGINIGSFVATIICAWLGETYGWSYGFGAAGLGMLIGLVTFLWGQKYLYGHAEPNNPKVLKESFLGPINKEWGIYILSTLSLILIWFLVQKIAIVFFTQNLFLLMSVVGLTYYAMFYKNEDQNRGLAKIFSVVIVLFGLMAVIGFTIDHFPDSLLGHVTLFNHFEAWIEPLAYVLLGMIIAFSIYGFLKTSGESYSRMIVLMFLIVSTIVFWALFEQSASSMTLFADRVIDRRLINAQLTNGDAWIFYVLAVISFVIAAFGFKTANAYRHIHNSPLKTVLMPTVLTGLIDIVLVLGVVIYQFGGEWITYFSYLGIFLLLLTSVVKAMSLAFILIGFFFNKDKATSITQTDATSSAASISIIAVTMLIVGGVCAYYGLFHLGGLADGQIENLVIEPTAGQFGSLNALFIFTLAPIFAALWVKLARVNLDPSTPVKFSLGLIQVGLGFGALLIGAMMPDASGKVAWVWLMLAYLLHTTGELSLSPVGLSAVTKLSIKSVVSMVMGVWFLATSLSEVVAVLLAKIAALDQQELLTLTVTEQLDKYNELWTTLLYLGVGFGLVLLLLSPLLKKGMKGIH